MKNLLIYINPNGFDEEHDILVKIQIDNSLELGWKKEDILLVTNFEYEYNGIKSMVVDGINFCYFRPLSTKTVTVAYLLEKGMINKGELYWVHDFDAYQLEPITEEEIGLDEEEMQAGFMDYGWSTKWCLGSYFFKDSAKNIFKSIKDTIYQYKIEDERALVALTRKNINNINDWYKKLNITYGFGMRNVASNYEKAIKPLKVIHFHPWHRGVKTLDIFMYGKNEMKIPLMTDRLIKIFNKYGIR